MLFSRSLRRALILNPKTGSSTLLNVFYGTLECSFSAANPRRHATYQEFFIPDKAEYEYTCFVRDPVERFISAYAYSMKVAGPRQTCSVEHILECDLREHQVGVVFRPQTEWLDGCPNLTVLPYANFEDEVVRIAGEFGIPNLHVPRVNASPNKTELTPSELKLVRDYYACDYDYFAAHNITV